MGSDDVATIEDLELRVKKMRALGVTKWGDIELGPEPPSTSGTDAEETQRVSAEEQERRARAEMRTRAHGASGGPRARLDGDGRH